MPMFQLGTMMPHEQREESIPSLNRTRNGVPRLGLIHSCSIASRCRAPVSSNVEGLLWVRSVRQASTYDQRFKQGGISVILPSRGAPSTY